MASPEKLKKYQKEKFENYKKITELKINDNEAYIELNVKDMNSIVSEFSTTDRIVLKKDFYDAIEQKVAYMPLDYPFVLEIHNKNFTAEEKIIVRKLIKNHFNLITISKEMELKAIKRKSSFFLACGIIGFIFLFLSYYFDIMSYLKEIISFIASFSIWEFAELLIFEQDNLKEEIILNKQLSKIRVVYNKDNG